MDAIFTEAEHRARLSRARTACRDAGLAGCVSVAPEHLYYLGGYEGHTHFSRQALVFGVEDDEPTLVVRDVDEPIARRTSWVGDVRLYRFGRDDPCALIASVVREKGIGPRVGVELCSHAMPGAFADELRAALAPVAVIDATDLVGRARIIKSERELELIREAASHAEHGRAAFLEALRPGITENALAGEVDRAMRGAGSDYPAMPTWLVSGPRSDMGHGTPGNRRIERGDPVHLEAAGAAHRYHALTIQTVSVGASTSRLREVYAACIESLRAGVAACLAGAPVADADLASLAPLAEAGLDDRPLMRFGYGISAAYPPSWLEPLHIIRESDDVFAPGMTFCAHIWLGLPDEGFGVLVGGTYALGSDGVECLCGGDFPLLETG